MRSSLLPFLLSLVVMGCGRNEPTPAEPTPTGANPAGAPATTSTTHASAGMSAVPTSANKAVPELEQEQERDACKSASECAVTMFQGCCSCNCTRPYGVSKERLEERKAPCAAVDCDMARCDRCEHSLLEWVPLCQSGICRAHLQPTD